MNEFADKFQDRRWIEKRDQIIEAANFECEDCGSSEEELQVHVCFYEKGKEPWELDEVAYKCLCPPDREKRSMLEQNIRKILAVFRIENLESLMNALEYLMQIRRYTSSGFRTPLYHCKG